MMQQQKELWIDTRLNQEEMDYLHTAISEENKESFLNKLAGNISKSEKIKDKDNWFYKTILKKHTEKLFYRENNNYYKYHVENETSPPEFEMYEMWVNYQKQHEFNPLHSHGGFFSFVIFMKIPTHWKEQHALPISVNSNSPNASDFVFVWSGGKDEQEVENVKTHHFRLSSEDEGRMLFFPAWLKHQVYPFYECEEERITISGNIYLHVPKSVKKQELSGGVYEDKKKMLKIMENSVEVTKKELKMKKKEREKEGLN